MPKSPSLSKTLCAAALLTSAAALPALAEFQRGYAVPIPDGVWAKMQGVTWHADLDCPTRDSLMILQIPHFDFAGEVQVGQLIVAADVAEDVLTIFESIGQAGFLIERMEITSNFEGSDDASMAANNTSGFNCRLVTGSTRLSQHSFGTAIDINPVQNPYVTRSATYPEAGKFFDEAKERDPDLPGLITAEGPVVNAFTAMGWSWGGNWNSLKDYQHFSLSGG